MFDLLESGTALPNLHPAVIHFPIALALTALALRFLQVIRPAWRTLETVAVLLTGLAALGGIAAWLAGKQAAGQLGAISLAAETQLSRHANLAGVTVLLLLAAAALALVVGRRGPAAGSSSRLPGLVGLAALAVAVGFMMVTADLGGALVYRHGVAVAAGPVPEIAAAGDADGEPVAAPGTVWNPVGSDSMVIRVDGAGLITLPGVFDDVAVTATVDPTGFTGQLALVHHAASVSTWEGFRLDSKGKVQLVQLREGREEILSGSSMVFPREKTTLRVTSAQGHYKGLVDGDMVVHGHGPAGDAGLVGLYYSGSGELRIHTLSAETTSDH